MLGIFLMIFWSSAEFFFKINLFKIFLSGFCLFDLILYVPSTIFQLNRDRSSWVEPVLSWDKCVLLKDHNTVTLVRLEPAASWSRVKHSTTEPLRSLKKILSGTLSECHTLWIKVLANIQTVCKGYQQTNKSRQ